MTEPEVKLAVALAHWILADVRNWATFSMLGYPAALHVEPEMLEDLFHRTRRQLEAEGFERPLALPLILKTLQEM
jgi:hypothetical protein